MRREIEIALVLCLCCALAGCATHGTSGTDTASAIGETPVANANASDATGANANDPAAFETTLNATVVDVADGDTVDVRLANGTEETVRMVGVDTPEVWVENAPGEFRGVPNTSAGRDCLREWGHHASDYTAARLAGANVTLAFDSDTDRRGYYGRLIAYVYVNGTNHDAALVERGLARVYDSGFSREPAFRRAAAAAYANRTGLWSCAANASADGTTGSTGSGTSGESATMGDGTSATGSTATTGEANGDSASSGTGLVVVRVHADAEGSDGKNLNDEYVVLHNAGTDPLALDGARVSDAAGHTYAFPNGTSIASDASLTLHTGAGTDDERDRYWDAGGPVWNNGGDTVTVRAADGTILARETYD